MLARTQGSLGPDGNLMTGAELSSDSVLTASSSRWQQVDLTDRDGGKHRVDRLPREVVGAWPVAVIISHPRFDLAVNFYYCY
jgi:hypothetical protein